MDFPVTYLLRENDLIGSGRYVNSCVIGKQLITFSDLLRLRLLTSAAPVLVGLWEVIVELGMLILFTVITIFESITAPTLMK